MVALVFGLIVLFVVLRGGIWITRRVVNRERFIAIRPEHVARVDMWARNLGIVVIVSWLVGTAAATLLTYGLVHKIMG